MTAGSYQVVGNSLVVVWQDGHESYYLLEQLRRECPCANCAGEPDLFGRIARGAPQRYAPESFQLRQIEAVGNYALLPKWADGHDWGIWTFERLRAMCDCEECKAKRGE